MITVLADRRRRNRTAAEDTSREYFVKTFLQTSAQYYSLQQAGDAAAIEAFVARKSQAVQDRWAFLADCVRASEMAAKSDQVKLADSIERSTDEYVMPLPEPSLA